MTIFIGLLAAIMILGAGWALYTDHIFKAIIVFGVVSLTSALFFLMMKAPDVAITEAAIGCGITVALFIFTYKKLED